MYYTIMNVNSEDGRYKKYLRDYRRKKYAENPQEILLKNKMYYYKRRNGVSDEETKKYGIYLPQVGRLKKAIEELNEQSDDVLQEVLKQYIQN